MIIHINQVVNRLASVDSILNTLNWSVFEIYFTLGRISI